ncbi:MAG: hypothetical protein IJV37_05895 [Bacteroidales bacterium]|nr:hypothetical protein [Bacteroidales bacterium]
MSKYKLTKIRAAQNDNLKDYFEAIDPYLIEKDSNIIAELDKDDLEVLKNLGLSYRVETKWHLISD